MVYTNDNVMVCEYVEWQSRVNMLKLQFVGLGYMNYERSKIH